MKYTLQENNLTQCVNKPTRYDNIIIILRHIDFSRTTLKSMCLSIRGPVMWNKLHSDLKNSTTVNMFKKRYKTFLVSEYEAT